MEFYYLKENIYQERKMVKEKNIVILVDYYLMEYIWMDKDGLVKVLNIIIKAI